MVQWTVPDCPSQIWASHFNINARKRAVNKNEREGKRERERKKLAFFNHGSVVFPGPTPGFRQLTIEPRPLIVWPITTWCLNVAAGRLPPQILTRRYHLLLWEFLLLLLLLRLLRLLLLLFLLLLLLPIRNGWLKRRQHPMMIVFVRGVSTTNSMGLKVAVIHSAVLPHSAF